jgi:hypothetical protein
MKKQILQRQILFIAFLFCTSLSYSQSFEGTLIYKCDIEVSEQMAKAGITKEIIIDKMAKEGRWSDTIKVSYKQGDYYTLLNARQKSYSIYKATTNKIYSMSAGADSELCTVTDASVDLEFQLTGNKPVIQKLDTTVIVNGTACSIVRVKWKTGTYDYYYNSTEFNVDPSLFSKHVYDGWAEFLKISKSLPIKIVKKTNGVMAITMTLVASKSQSINDDLFKIPALVPDKDLNAQLTSNKEIMRIKK